MKNLLALIILSFLWISCDKKQIEEAKKRLIGEKRETIKITNPKEASLKDVKI